MAPTKKLLQDVRTRWNSTLVCLRRLLELKEAVSLLLLTSTLPAQFAHGFNNQDWDLINSLINILTPFEELTLESSREESTISLIHPAIKVLKTFLLREQNASNDEGLRDLLTSLVESLERRSQRWQVDKNILLATMLDPRYKTSTFDNATKKMCESFIIQSSQSICSPQPASSTSSESKHMKSSVWDLAEDESPNIPDSIEIEMEKYWAEKRLDRTSCPFNWWKLNRQEFPVLSVLAQKYLSAPPTSVSSERLFSSAGLVYSDRRKALKPAKAEQLLFCKAFLAFQQRGCDEEEN
jgi:hypothetical protein